MPPIPTVYQGIEYRSRLEARWAAFMSNIGWEHTYEPFDGEGYIPDFVVHGQRPLLVEVKPAITMQDFRNPLNKIETGLASFAHDVLIAGADPLPVIQSSGGDPLTAGLIGEREDGQAFRWATGHWTRCLNCKSIAVFHSLMSFTCRPCGCYDGDHYLGDIPEWVLRSFWGDACNSVKWRGRAA